MSNTVTVKSGAANVYQATLQDFKNAFQLKGSGFKTSVGSTRGVLYVKDGQLCSANRHGGSQKVESSVTNHALRNALVDAFRNAGATEDFMLKLREQLLQGSDSADLDRKTVKGLISEFEKDGCKSDADRLESLKTVSQKALGAMVGTGANLSIDDFRQLALGSGYVWNESVESADVKDGTSTWTIVESGALHRNEDYNASLRGRLYDIVKEETEKSADLQEDQKFARKLLLLHLEATLIGTDLNKPLSCDEIRRTLAALDGNMSYVPAKALSDRKITVTSANKDLADFCNACEKSSEAIDTFLLSHAGKLNQAHADALRYLSSLRREMADLGRQSLRDDAANIENAKIEMTKLTESFASKNPDAYGFLKELPGFSSVEIEKETSAHLLSTLGSVKEFDELSRLMSLPDGVKLDFKGSHVELYTKFSANLSKSHDLATALAECDQKILDEELLSPDSGLTMTVREAFTVIANSHLAEKGKADWSGVIANRLEERAYDPADFRYPAILSLVERNEGFKTAVEKRIGEVFNKKLKAYNEANPEAPSMGNANPMKDDDKKFFCGLFCKKNTYGSTLNLGEFMSNLIKANRNVFASLSAKDCWNGPNSDYYPILMAPSFIDLPEVKEVVAEKPLELPKSISERSLETLAKIQEGAKKLEHRMSELEPKLKDLGDRLTQRYTSLHDNSPEDKRDDPYARLVACETLFGKGKEEVGFFGRKLNDIRGAVKKIHLLREELLTGTGNVEVDDEAIKKISKLFSSLEACLGKIELAGEEFSTIGDGESSCEIEDCLEVYYTKLEPDKLVPVNENGESNESENESGESEEESLADKLGGLTNSVEEASWDQGVSWTNIGTLSNSFEHDAELLCVLRGMRDFVDSQEWKAVDCFTQAEKDVISGKIEGMKFKAGNSISPSIGSLIEELGCWGDMPLGEKKRNAFECLYAQFVSKHFNGGYLGLQVPRRLQLSRVPSYVISVTEDQEKYTRALYSYFGRPLADDTALEDLACARDLGWTGVEYDPPLDMRLTRAQLKERIDRNFSTYHVMDAEDALNTKGVLEAEAEHNPGEVDARIPLVWDESKNEPELSDLRRLASELMSSTESRHLVLKDQTVRKVFDNHKPWIKKAVHWLAMQKVKAAKLIRAAECENYAEKDRNYTILAWTLKNKEFGSSASLLEGFGLAEDAANVLATFLDSIMSTVFEKCNEGEGLIGKHFTIDIRDKDKDIGKQMSEAEKKGYGPLMDAFEKNVTGPVEAQLTVVCNKIQEKVSDYFKEKFPTLPAGSTQETIRSETLTQATAPDVPLEDVLKKNQVDLDAELVRRVLNTYFTKIPLMDRHLLMATKFGHCNVEKDEAAEVKDRKNISALLKSSGPVLIKMLQGLDASLFKDEIMRDILKELKGELYPIPESQRDILLKAAIQKWNSDDNNVKQITAIECGPSLGAASVGETLACKVTYEDGTSADCAVKLLRPEARLRAERERDIFLKVAEEMDKELGTNMYATYKGKLDAIMRELDLTDEATFVGIGKEAYENETWDLTCGEHDKVHSESLTEGTSPSRNVMLLQKAEGTTVQKHFADLRKKFDELKANQAPRKDFDELLKKTQQCHQSLEQLAKLWFARAVFCEQGFYHGDLHAGNVMIDKDDNLTLIDYGNAKQLSAEEAKAFVHIVAGAAAGISAPNDGVVYGFAQLVPAGRERDEFLRKVAEPEIDGAIQAILKKGKGTDCGMRLQAILQVFKSCGVEIPGAIYNFIESQVRLANMLSESKRLVDEIEDQQDIKDHQSRDLFVCVADVVSTNQDKALSLLGKIFAPLFMAGFVQNGLMTKDAALDTVKKGVVDSLPDFVKKLIKDNG